MKVYTYRIDHDYGLAPNPFGRYCTLAVCKSKIRRSNNFEIGDWVIGTGSKALENLTGKEWSNRLIYAMKVTEKITMQDYWDDPRFQYKKPMMKGTLVSMFGDNFYHKDTNGEWIQEDSAHSNKDGSCNFEHKNKDTGGKNVLISEQFYYFGDNALLIPIELSEICHTTQGEKILKEQLQSDFLNWLLNNFHEGMQGTPINWKSLII